MKRVYSAKKLSTISDYFFEQYPHFSENDSQSIYEVISGLRDAAPWAADVVRKYYRNTDEDSTVSAKEVVNVLLSFFDKEDGPVQDSEDMEDRVETLQYLMNYIF